MFHIDSEKPTQQKSPQSGINLESLAASEFACTRHNDHQQQCKMKDVYAEEYCDMSGLPAPDPRGYQEGANSGLDGASEKEPFILSDSYLDLIDSQLSYVQKENMDELRKEAEHSINTLIANIKSMVDIRCRILMGNWKTIK